jgi:hypothetical protein
LIELRYTFSMFIGRSTGTRPLIGLFTALILITSLFIIPTYSFAVTQSCTFPSNGTLTGSATTIGNDCVITYTSGTGTWTAPAGITSVQYLVVGGGGAGGSRAGGGGGAGGYIASTNFATTPTNGYTVTVGSGGAGQVSGNGTSGTNSVFASNTGIGGGGGGGAAGSNNTLRNGLNGGSGGGASGDVSGTGLSATPGTSQQALVNSVGGYNGGSAVSGNYWPAGGGGGATGAGASAASSTSASGNGGAGQINNITGTNVCYATGGGAGSEDIGAGAGSGGSCTGIPTPHGNSGSVGSATPTGIVANTGAGGGGSGWSGGADQKGEAGASGVVIIRYTYQYTIVYNANTGSGTAPTDSNGYSLAGGTNATIASGSALSLTSYAFAGWCTVQVSPTVSCSGTAYSAGQSFVPTTSLLLYALWNILPTTLSISFNSLGNNFQYGKSLNIIATATGSNGNATFYYNNKKIFHCISLATTGLIATCPWKPTAHGGVWITASISPTSTGYLPSSATPTLLNVITRSVSRG